MKKIIFTLLFSAICGLGSYAISVTLTSANSYNCPGGTVTLTATPIGVPAGTPLTYFFYFGSVSSGTLLNPSGLASSASSVTYNVTPPYSGFYTVKMVYGSATSTATANVNVTNIPLPIITGTQTVCSYGTPITYNFGTNYIGVNYTIALSNSTGTVSSQPYTNGNFNVNWTSISPGATITVTGTMNGCTVSTSWPVYPCCSTGLVTFNNTNTSNPTILSWLGVGNTVSNKTFSIDGNFDVLSGTVITFDNCNITMGTNAKINIQPNARLIFSNSHISSCQNGGMWDGIYVQSSTSELQMQGCILEDAKTAITSDNTGNFYLAGSVFNNNYRNVVINNLSGYSATSDHQVEACVFTCRNLHINTTMPISTLVNDILMGYNAVPQHGTSATAFSVQYNGATVYCEVDFLKYPYTSKRTYSGIELNNCEGPTPGGGSYVQIGYSTTGGTYPIAMLIFDYMDFGLRVFNSSEKSINCMYENMIDIPGSSSPCCGAWAAKKGSTYLIFNLGGNGSIGENDTFYNCTIGAQSTNYNYTNVVNCYFYAIKNTCVDIEEFKDNLQDINGNKMGDEFVPDLRVNGGVYAYNSGSSSNNNGHLNIFSNYIYCNYPTLATNSVANYGIYVAQQSLQMRTINIGFLGEGNEIHDARYGIYISNVGGVPSSAIPNICGNSIYFTPNLNPINNNTQYFGIKVSNSDNSYVANNTISNTAIIPTSLNTPAMKGISIETSPRARVSENKMTHMAAGIYGFFTCPNSSFTCNTNDRCYNGFNFLNATISDQGTTSSSSNNQWIQNLTTTGDITGSFGSMFTWYYNGAINSNTNPVNHTTTLTNYPTYTPAAINLNCSPPAFASQVTYREAMLGEILRNEIVYDTLSQQYKLLDSIFAYKEISKDTTLLHLGTFEDALYQALYDSLKKSNIGKFQQVLNYVQDSILPDTLAAKLANQNIQSQNTSDENQKLVNAIYLNEIKNMEDSLGGAKALPYDSTEIAQLLNVAYQNPMHGGTAVYQARAMLFIDVIDDVFSEKHLIHHNLPIVANLAEYKMYPNPNNGTMQLSYSLSENETGYVIITNLFGEKVNSYKLINGTNTINITEAELNDGIYFYQVYKNDSKVYTGKIIINK